MTANGEIRTQALELSAPFVSLLKLSAEDLFSRALLAIEQRG